MRYKDITGNGDFVAVPHEEDVAEMYRQVHEESRLAEIELQKMMFPGSTVEEKAELSRFKKPDMKSKDIVEPENVLDNNGWRKK